MKPLPDEIIKLLSSIIVSLLGGLAKVLNRTEKPTLWRIFREMIISGFAGVMTYYLIKDVSFIGESIKMFLVGMAGYSSAAILDYFEKIEQKFLKKIS